MLIVGLTGNIASGKTTVARMFRQLGAEVIDADKLGHKLLNPGSLIWKRTVDAFGEGILNYNQSINRKKLGQIVFEEPQKLKRLNAIVRRSLMQKIKEEISRIKKREKQGIIIIDGALIIEMQPIYKLVDYLIVVKIDKVNQLKRLAKSQSHLTKSRMLQRIKAQTSQQGKIKLADFVIDNSGSIKKTKKQIKIIWGRLNK